jgi:type 1 fimbria pilin
MKLKLIALSLVLSAASSSAFAALDGGQLNFAGLVSDNTCTPHVNGGSQDGQIQLTAVSADITAGVSATAPGVQPELSISPSTVVLLQQTRVQS